MLLTRDRQSYSKFESGNNGHLNVSLRRLGAGTALGAGLV